MIKQEEVGETWLPFNLISLPLQHTINLTWHTLYFTLGLLLETYGTIPRYSQAASSSSSSKHSRGYPLFSSSSAEPQLPTPSHLLGLRQGQTQPLLLPLCVGAVPWSIAGWKQGHMIGDEDPPSLVVFCPFFPPFLFDPPSVFSVNHCYRRHQQTELKQMVVQLWAVDLGVGSNRPPSPLLISFSELSRVTSSSSLSRVFSSPKQQLTSPFYSSSVSSLAKFQWSLPFSLPL